jgi:hypothetical protein
MEIVLNENIAQAISEDRSGGENRWIIIQKTDQKPSLCSHACELFPDFNWVAVTVDAEPTVSLAVDSETKDPLAANTR